MPLVYNFDSERKFKQSEKLKTCRWKLNEKTFYNKINNPDNADYYQDLYNGLLNQTSTHNINLFSSYHYLYKVDDILQNTVDILNETGSKINPKNVSNYD